ncbi:hypothetical protein [Pseudomonas sp. RIT-PI-S]|uniref:hypothetical protein n=1 Tax=Pseudomonas sp. RIT-PI-S TaxID=3035295 RepID=UPI0021D872C5|nr:hypothetical protein [Pseudomonas sp. RIT-PI-S]
MEHKAGHEDWVGTDHSPKEHKETLGNGAVIHVIVRQLAAEKYEADMTVLDGNGAALYHAVKTRDKDPGPASEVLKFAVDEAKRHAAGHRGAPLDNHHQKTPI